MTQGPEQHSPSRVWSLQRAKKCARRALETGYGVCAALARRVRGYGAGAQAHANRFLALNHAARPFSQGCTMINTQHTTRNLTVTEKTCDFFYSRNSQSRNGILLPKLFFPTVRKKCSSDREKLLKFKAEGQEFAKFLRSLE